jgi:WD repeat-containing protein 19
MRKDLLEWDTALRLAETLAPAQVPAISLELAKQLEFRGDHQGALAMYQQAQAKMGGQPPSSEAGGEAGERLREALLAGVARMTIRLGDVRKGMQIALESGSKQLCKECGAILES